MKHPLLAERNWMEMTVFPGVTIDAEHSFDLDDAIWVERLAAGAKVTVAISLVAEHVAIDSDLDCDAYARGFTRYAAQSAVRPMLPKALSENTLSLLPGGGTNVIAFEIVLDDNLEIVSAEISRGILDNRSRLSHEAAGGLIESGKGDVGRMLRDAWALSAALLDKRRKAGAIAYFSAGTGMLTNEEGNLVDLGTSEAVSRAYVVVQEMMILANHAVTDRLAREGVHLLFRNHRGNPVADRSSLSTDLELATQGGPFKMAAGKRIEMMIGKATLGAKAKGHFGLNLPVYARMTSPIRRYEDLVNQRILLAYIDKNGEPYAPEELEVIGTTLDALARNEAAERSAHMKEASARRAARLQASGEFLHLDQTQMTAVVKAAVESQTYSHELVREIERRLMNETLTAKDMGRLLLAEGDAAAPCRAVVMGHFERSPFAAVSVINYLHQDGWIGMPEWNEANAAAGFQTQVTALLGGKTFQHSQEASSKKLSRQRAAVGLLAEMAGIGWKPPKAWSTFPAQAVPAHTPSAAVDINAKGTLITLCQTRGLPMPRFAVTSQGASHDPTFTAVASVPSGGGVVQTEPVTASSKKEAERLAAAALIQRLMHEPRKAVTLGQHSPGKKPKPGGGNAKNALQETCQKRGWPLPKYEFVQSGPSHSPTFSGTVQVVANGRKVQSGSISASSRKEAEMLAAAAVIKLLPPG